MPNFRHASIKTLTPATFVSIRLVGTSIERSLWLSAAKLRAEFGRSFRKIPSTTVGS